MISSYSKLFPFNYKYKYKISNRISRFLKCVIEIHDLTGKKEYSHLEFFRSKLRFCKKKPAFDCDCDCLKYKKNTISDL